jgi:hypothetical protein
MSLDKLTVRSSCKDGAPAWKSMQVRREANQIEDRQMTNGCTLMTERTAFHDEESY